MTTPNIEELIAILEATNQFHDDADICTADVIAALQSQAERINDLETEAEQLRKGHFDTSEANAVRAAASCCAGREIMNLPPLPTSGIEAIGVNEKPLTVYTADQMREYGELCHKMALEEAHAWMMQRHQAQKHRDNYMLVEANRFKKDLLVLPRVEQGSVPKQVKPHSSGEVVYTVTWDVVQAKDQPS